MWSTVWNLERPRVVTEILYSIFQIGGAEKYPSDQEISALPPFPSDGGMCGNHKLQSVRSDHKSFFSLHRCTGTTTHSALQTMAASTKLLSYVESRDTDKDARALPPHASSTSALRLIQQVTRYCGRQCLQMAFYLFWRWLSPQFEGATNCERTVVYQVIHNSTATGRWNFCLQLCASLIGWQLRSYITSTPSGQLTVYICLS